MSPAGRPPRRRAQRPPAGQRPGGQRPGGRRPGDQQSGGQQFGGPQHGGQPASAQDLTSREAELVDRLADGGKATNIGSERNWPDATDPAHGMQTHSGSSSSGEAEQRFSVWPVPAAGDIVFVCEWPAHGIAESRLTLDGDQLRAAAARARPVWPDEGGPDGVPETDG